MCTDLQCRCLCVWVNISDVLMSPVTSVGVILAIVAGKCCQLTLTGTPTHGCLVDAQVSNSMGYTYSAM